jgi:hypothetical protein
MDISGKTAVGSVDNGKFVIQTDELSVGGSQNLTLFPIREKE